MLLLNAFFVFQSPAAAQKDFTQWVDPRIGTAHCRWFHFTPGALPFGMAKPAPSTNGSLGNANGWEATGYDYRDSSIEGFANFHEFQVGGIVFAPSVGELQTVAGTPENPESGYRSRFDRKDEICTAGYYSVLLKDDHIRAELTATQRVAYHRYSFPKSASAHIIFDIGHQQGESGAVTDAEVSITDDGRIEGWVTTMPVYINKYQPGATLTLYFSALVDKKFSSFGAFNGKEIRANVKQAKGIGAGVYLTFDTNEQEPVTVRSGLSYTSVSNARLNLEKEARGLSFEQARSRSKAIWNSYLGRIDAEGGSKENLTKFYTGLYHALLGRGLASDVNGAYPKNDGAVGQIPLSKSGEPLHQHYNSDAVWGTYWNLTQLWALAYPEYYADFIKSQLLIYKDAGWLGDGIAASRFVSGVGTNFMGLVIASGYLSGIRDFDVNTGYEAARKNELEWRNRPFGAGKSDVDRFIKYGYVNHLDKGDSSAEHWQFSASHTLEYAFSAYAVAQWARLLGKKNDYDQLIKLSTSWEQIYDSSLKFVRPKLANGRFIDNFNPAQPWRGFQEGNAWQYTYFVPHDMERLVQRMGADTFADRLDSIFRISQKNLFGGGATIDAFAGVGGIYNHGNQPNLHVSWLFNYADKPSLTQKWVRAICDQFYGTGGVHGYGYGQDEDQGQLGAWYVMSALGLFDIKGLTSAHASFGIGSPLFKKTTIRLSPHYYGGKKFVIEAKNNSSENIFIQSAQYNNTRLHRPFISFKDVVNGGTLLLEMGQQQKNSY